MTSPLSAALWALAASCLIAVVPSVPASAAGAIPAAPVVSSGHGRGPSGPGMRHGGFGHGGWQNGSWNNRPWHNGAWHGAADHRWDGRRFERRMLGWGAFDGGWTAFAPGWAETAPLAPFALLPDDEVLRPRLPTAADLPVAGQRRPPVGPAVLYEIDDLSQGRSGRLSGARIVSATKPTPLPGSSPTGGSGRGGPLIIHLTAR